MSGNESWGNEKRRQQTSADYGVFLDYGQTCLRGRHGGWFSFISHNESEFLPSTGHLKRDSKEMIKSLKSVCQWIAFLGFLYPPWSEIVHLARVVWTGLMNRDKGRWASRPKCWFFFLHYLFMRLIPLKRWATFVDAVSGFVQLCLKQEGKQRIREYLRDYYYILKYQPSKIYHVSAPLMYFFLKYPSLIERKVEKHLSRVSSPCCQTKGQFSISQDLHAVRWQQ